MWDCGMPTFVHMQGVRRVKRVVRSKKSQYDGKQCFIQRPRLRTIPEEEHEHRMQLALKLSLESNNNKNISKMRRSSSESNLSKSKDHHIKNQHAYVWKGNSNSKPKNKSSKNLAKEDSNVKKSKLKKMLHFLTVPREESV